MTYRLSDDLPFNPSEDLRAFWSMAASFSGNQKRTILSSAPDVSQMETLLGFEVLRFEDWNLLPSFPWTHDVVSTSRRRLHDVCYVEKASYRR